MSKKGETNGCTHVRTRDERQGDDLVYVCMACGEEVGRSVDYYK